MILKKYRLSFYFAYFVFIRTLGVRYEFVIKDKRYFLRIIWLRASFFTQKNIFAASVEKNTQKNYFFFTWCAGSKLIIFYGLST